MTEGYPMQSFSSFYSISSFLNPVKSLCRFSNFMVNNASSLFIFMLLIQQNKASCEPPAGSYLETCEIEGADYHSTDPNLSTIPICKFDFSCEKLPIPGYPFSETKYTTIYLPKSMKNCVEFIENCDGWPVTTTKDKQCDTKEKAFAMGEKAKAAAYKKTDPESCEGEAFPACSRP
jgi:hypothetical protein